MTDVTTAPVFLPEALARALPDCKNNQHKVKVRLETLQREGDIRLLANGVPMAPGATPTMLGVEADTLHGRPILYIDVRKGLTGDYPIWDGETLESLERHHRFWAYERTTFEACFPGKPVVDQPPNVGEPKNLGGRSAEYEVRDLLTEALVYAGVAGKLPKTVEGEGSLHEQLKRRLGPRCPERTRFREIFSPIYRRIKNERPR